MAIITDKITISGSYTGTTPFFSGITSSSALTSTELNKLVPEGYIKQYIDNQIGVSNELYEVLSNGNSTHEYDIIMSDGDGGYAVNNIYWNSNNYIQCDATADGTLDFYISELKAVSSDNTDLYIKLDPFGRGISHYDVSTSFRTDVIFPSASQNNSVELQDGSGTLAFLSDVTGATHTVYGNNTEIQYNNNGEFGSSQYFYYSATTKALTLGTRLGSEGVYSVAIGNNSTANGHYSLSQGQTNIASGEASHAEGTNNIASGHSSHVEGRDNVAGGNYSHAQGNNTLASGTCSFAGGYSSTVSGEYSAIIGGSGNTVAGETSGIFCGIDNIIDSNCSESAVLGGANNVISGNTVYSFIGGGSNNESNGDYSAILGGNYNTISGKNSVVGGYGCIVNGDYSFALGRASISNSDYSIVLGRQLSATSLYSAAIGGAQNLVQHTYSVILGGSNMTSQASNTVSVKQLDFGGSGQIVDGISTVLNNNDNTKLITEGAVYSVTSAMQSNISSLSAKTTDGNSTLDVSGITTTFVEYNSVKFAKKIINIGPWDMSADASPGVINHGLNADNIRAVSILIIPDGLTYPYRSIDGYNGGNDTGSFYITSTGIVPTRVYGGSFDDPAYSSTTQNRGYITIDYIL